MEIPLPIPDTAMDADADSSLYREAVPGDPAGVSQLPSPVQVNFQRTEMTSFIYYRMATNDGSEQGNPLRTSSV